MLCPYCIPDWMNCLISASVYLHTGSAGVTGKVSSGSEETGGFGVLLVFPPPDGFDGVDSGFDGAELPPDGLEDVLPPPVGFDGV